jgi:hypothetical protein
MVEVLDLLAEDEVLEQSRASCASLQTELIFDRPANIGRHEAAAVVYLVLGKEV